MPSNSSSNSAGHVKAEPARKASHAASRSDDEYDDDNDEDMGLTLEDAGGVPIYTDGDLYVRQVNQPLIVNRKLDQLYNLIQKGFVELNPEYQREVVWDQKRASGLIKSLMQGFFIPPVIFNVQMKDGHKYRVCVDGKQRLSSVVLFMNGEIGFEDSSSPPKKWYYCNPKDANGNVKNTNHLILPPKTRAIIRNRTFCCYEFENLTPAVEEDMFQLVQRGMPLSPAEKMRALSTQWAQFCKKYETDYSSVVGLNSTARAAGFRMIVSICTQVMEVDHPSGAGHTPTFAISPAKLTTVIKDDRLLTEKLKRTYKKIFDRFQELLDECLIQDGSVTGAQINQNSCFGRHPEALREQKMHHVKTFSPLEVFATALLIHLHGDERNNVMLKGDIMDMRVYLRENHQDLRLNSQCWATVWEYLNNQLFLRRGGSGVMTTQVSGKLVKRIRGGPAERDVTSSAEPSARPRAPVAPMMASNSESNSTKQGRKRMSDGVNSLFEEQDEDDSPPPPRRRKVAHQMDGAFDSPSPSDELVDVKPSLEELSIQGTIQPRKRISDGSGLQGSSNRLAKRTKPSGPSRNF